MRILGHSIQFFLQPDALSGNDIGTGFDHAGKWETSLLMGTYPELVDLDRCERNTEWFAQSAKEASAETGKHMVACTLEWLREAIQ